MQELIDKIITIWNSLPHFVQIILMIIGGIIALKISLKIIIKITSTLIRFFRCKQLMTLSVYWDYSTDNDTLTEIDLSARIFTEKLSNCTQEDACEYIKNLYIIAFHHYYSDVNNLDTIIISKYMKIFEKAYELRGGEKNDLFLLAYKY